jgi:zinc D-Ala-D-Ala dipeptidase
MRAFRITKTVLIFFGAAAFSVAAFAHQASVHSGRDLPRGFVRLTGAAPGIAQDMRYASRANVLGRALAGYDAGTCIVRTRTAAALARAQRALAPQGYGLMVFDCYRPARAVGDLVRYSQTTPRTAAPYHPGVTGPQLLAQGYVARQSGHSTGLAVDITLIHLDARARPKDHPSCGGPWSDHEADLGTGFDCFDAKAGDAAALTPDQAARRKILRDAMMAAGFRPYAREWWHFSLPPRNAAERQTFDFNVN